MRAVVITALGTEPELAEMRVDEPGPGELLVRLRAAGVNPFDWKVADGALEGVVEHRLPFVMGSDGAGVVVEVGAGVTRFRPGDRVYGQFMRLPDGQGSYAEYTLVAEDGKLGPIPDDLSFTIAAALPIAGVTAYQAIQSARLAPDHVILVNGASGGVGQFAVQFAANLGARVLATGPTGLTEHLRDLGAEQVIDFAAAPTADQVLARHPDGIDAVLDLVSTAGNAGPLVEVLRPGGIFLSTNWAADIDVLAARELRGVNIANNASHEDLAALADLAAAGKLHVRIDQEIPLAQAPAAIARLRTSHSTGKTVLTP
jgi:NADPH:quinone reductase-like Zn-dependent oxidoreductase